jgi:ankyrin repeat protein
MSKRLRTNQDILSDLESDDESVSHKPKKLPITFLNFFALVENYSDNLLHFFEFAINHGYGVETKNSLGDTLLTHAVKHNAYSLVKYLLSKTDANINHRNNDNLNALLLSISINECYKDINELIEELPNNPDYEGQNVYDILDDLDPNQAIVEEDEPVPYVNEITKLLVEKYKALGLDLNCTDSNGNNPLILAIARTNNKALVEYLINEGRANIEHRNKHNFNALLFSIPYNRIYEEYACSDERVYERVDDVSEITKILLETYKKLNISIDCIDDDGNTPLFLAIKNNENTSLVKLFLKYGANVNHRNKENQNALYLSIDTVNVVSITREVIEYGADVNEVDEYGHTPLSYAIRSSDDPGSYMIEVLINNGAKLTYYDKEGNFHDLRDDVHSDFSEEEHDSNTEFRPIEVLHEIQN